ncbi:protein NRT1/ PTR FAMILY 5.4-like protein [Cinnamomum micranthum f. kanehirae]|uniref:Protein NRT1/ PTR FAMILY 5.4-like protein n=1 Tax=Cinnamomum micranthum f. kanehirae TaxID=337451 RepID=A0A3S3NRY2_9MAGN|nr:protein NRT1/ PTR FAMILY 5.4-like protein [Cinnamomum micranthum f. kanehirae]
MLHVQTKFLVFGLQGLVTLTLAVTKIHHQYGKSLFFISLYLVAIGQGGYMSCLLPFGADQFDEDSLQERQAKNSFFNWCFFTLCFSATSAMLIIVYIHENAPIGNPLTRIVKVLVAATSKWHLHSIEESQEDG